MSGYAIIQIGGKQFRVAEGETLVIDRVEAQQDKPFVVSDVLMVKTDAATLIGQPFVDKAKVEFEFVKDQRGEKLDIFRFKAKSRYRRHQGHRQEQTVLRVNKITV